MNALQPGSLHADIPKATVGIALLGTPHLGSDMAAFATSIARMTEIAENFGGSASDTSIMETLRKDSKALIDVVHNFMMWVNNSNVDVRFFYETEKTNWSKKAGGMLPFGNRVNDVVSVTILS